jgi:hypothetical protein
MKKFVALAVILCLGLFCAVGCTKTDATKKTDSKKVENKEGEKGGTQTPPVEPEKKVEEPKK